MNSGRPESVRLAAEAMATRFELVVHSDDPVSARAAGEEALREIVRLEEVFSFYRPDGALGRLNRTGGSGSVRVPTVLFELLSLCDTLHRATGGCFDPSVGPLMRAWGLAGGDARMPSDDELEAVRRSTGFEHVRLDPSSRSVAFDLPGLALDLGGVAKGYAVDEAMALLSAAGVENALLHGGTSTIRAMGPGPDGVGWRVGIPEPGPSRGSPAGDRTLSATVTLRDESLSVSEISGKGFIAGDTFHGHVLDPRTGRPVNGALMAAVAGPAAVDTDALSTALLVLGADARSAPAFTDSRFRWMVALRAGESVEFIGEGLTPTRPDP